MFSKKKKNRMASEIKNRLQSSSNSMDPAYPGQEVAAVDVSEQTTKSGTKDNKDKCC